MGVSDFVLQAAHGTAVYADSLSLDVTTGDPSDVSVDSVRLDAPTGNVVQLHSYWQRHYHADDRQPLLGTWRRERVSTTGS